MPWEPPRIALTSHEAILSAPPRDNTALKATEWIQDADLEDYLIFSGAGRDAVTCFLGLTNASKPLADIPIESLDEAYFRKSTQSWL